MGAPDSTALPEDPAQLRVLCKPSLYARKQAWAELALADVPAMVAGWDPQAFAQGQIALWLSPRADTAQGRAYLPFWDVESPDAHGDLAENIKAAQGLFLRLSEAGLDAGLTILLTGRGLRFVWPFAVEPELAAPFLALLRDKARWPGIDPQPQVSGVPLALAGWRGHRSQGGKGDLHFHALADPSELLELTAHRYADLVAGPADLAACQTLVGCLQPKSWTPPAWRAVLAEYQRDLALRRHVVKIRFPARPEGPRRVSWEAIEDHLAGRSVRLVREIEADGRPVKLLSECPSCGRKHKAWLTAGATLKCWSSSCEAGQYATGLDGIPFRQGLRLAAWAPGLAPSEGEVEPERHEPPRADAVSLEDARRLVRDALAGPEEALLIRASAGTGKSFAAMAYALTEAAKGGLVLMTCPTTDLARELETKAREMAGKLGLETDLRRYEGRNAENCDQASRCDKVAARGFSPALLVCPSCHHREGCGHRHQLDGMSSGVLFAAHAAATTVVSKLGKRLTTWVVDESPLDSFLRSNTVHEGSMTALRAKLVTKAESVLTKAARAAEKMLGAVPAQGGHQARLYGSTPPPGEWEHTRPLWEQAGVTDAERQALADALDFFDPLEGEKAGAWQKRLWAEHVDIAALGWWRCALGEKQGSAYVQARHHATDPIRYLAQVNATPAVSCRVVCLDATGDPAELRALFGREFKVVDAAVTPPPGRRVWIRQGLGKWKAQGLEEAGLEKYLRQACAHLRPIDRRVLLVTHLAVEEPLLALARRMDPSREWASCHHWASRGVNTWEAFDAAVVVGTGTPNRAAKFDEEMALFGNDTAAREAWFNNLGVRDLIQSTARVRPVLSGKTVIVLGRVWPTASLGAPSFTVDARRKGGAAEAEQEAYERLLPLAQEFGLMFTEMAYLAGVFRAEDKAQAEDWLERIQPWTDGKTPPAIVPTVIKTILIRVTTMADGVLEPIRFRNRDAWSQLIARLADATGLPDLAYKPRSAHGGGRAQAALGTINAVRAFTEACDQTFDPTIWAGQEVHEMPDTIDTIDTIDTTTEAAAGRRLTAAELIEWPEPQTPPPGYVDPGPAPGWNPWRMAAAADFSDYGVDPQVDRQFFAWERRAAALAAMAVA